MNSKQIINAIDESFYTVGVVYAIKDGLQQGMKLYTYKVKKDIDLDVGDIVVVECKDELKCAMVMEIHEIIDIDFNSNIDYKWIIQKVDMENYQKQLDVDKSVNEQIKLAEVKKRREQARQLALEIVDQTAIENARKMLGGE